MSIREVFSGAQTEEGKLFSELTAEAWMDPQLTEEIARDKHAAIARFARKRGFAVPPSDAIESFVLPDNPIGELKLVTPTETMVITQYPCDSTSTCTTACGPCPTEYGCVTDDPVMCTYSGCTS